MEKRIDIVLLILTFIMMLLIPNIAFSNEYEITFHWEHSGRGMDKFVFSPSPTNAGPWVDGYSVMIEDLTPTIVDGKNRWSGTITVNTENEIDLQWWVVYAESSWGKKSEYSTPARSIFPPQPPTAFERLNTTPIKMSVWFM